MVLFSAALARVAIALASAAPATALLEVLMNSRRVLPWDVLDEFMALDQLRLLSIRIVYSNAP